MNADRFGGLTALETRREVYRADRRVVLTRSASLHAGQARGLDQTLAKAGAKLTDLAATLARGNTRRDTAAVTAEMSTALTDPWAGRVITWGLTGNTRPSAHGPPGASGHPHPHPAGERGVRQKGVDRPTGTTGRSPR